MADDKKKTFDDPEVGPNLEGAINDFAKSLEAAYQGVSGNKEPKKEPKKDPKAGG